MRIYLLAIFLVGSVALKAQLYRGAQNAGNLHTSTTSLADKKWFLSKYSGISTGFSFFNGGSATFVSAPIGLQLNRKLNKNLYAFAGVSAAPTYINFNRAFANPDLKGHNSFGRYNQLGIYSRAEVGLMYINDAKTFSFSGSIGVQRGTNSMLPFQQIQTMQQTPIVRPHH